jgi:cytochrome c biogenesis protein CcmG/thiol:disulfide interchange protein DsbE
LVSLAIMAGGLLIPAGRTTPPLQAFTLEGEAWNERLTGQVTIVEFFATWCPHCRRSLAGYQWLQQTRRVRMIIVDVEEEPALVAAFFTEHPPPSGAGVLVDPSKHASRRWGVTGYPTTYLLDAAGVVRRSFSGWDDDSAAELAELIDDLRRPPPPPGARATVGSKSPSRPARRRGGKKNSSPARPPTHDERARQLGVEVLR